MSQVLAALRFPSQGKAAAGGPEELPPGRGSACLGQGAVRGAGWSGDWRGGLGVGQSPGRLESPGALGTRLRWEAVRQRVWVRSECGVPAGPSWPHLAPGPASLRGTLVATTHHTRICYLRAKRPEHRGLPQAQSVVHPPSLGVPLKCPEDTEPLLSSVRPGPGAQDQPWCGQAAGGHLPRRCEHTSAAA